jgi:glycosyltransferase involved in cell wall biosynthesis
MQSAPCRDASAGLADAGKVEGEVAAPVVSVVIPCYNGARYILATLASVLAQDIAAMEVIVIDDGSRDGSAELVRQAYPQVRVEVQANAGVAAARNRGIALARGEFIAFVDADDIWLRGKLAAQLAMMAAHPECRMNYAPWQVWDSDQPAPSAAELAAVADSAADSARWAGPSGWIYPSLLLDCHVWTSTVLARRSLFDEIGVFDPTLRLGEDYDLWLRASRVTPILRLPRPFALYRLHAASITHSRPNGNHRARVIESALAQWGYQSPDGTQADRAAVERMLAKTWSDYAAAQLYNGQVQPARESSWKALRLSGRHVAGWKVLIKSYLPGSTASRES